MVTWLCFSWGHAWYAEACWKALCGRAERLISRQARGRKTELVQNLHPQWPISPSHPLHGHHATVASSILKITALRIQSFPKDQQPRSTTDNQAPRRSLAGVGGVQIQGLTSKIQIQTHHSPPNRHVSAYSQLLQSWDHQAHSSHSAF